MQWSKSKADVYLARMIWFIAGLIAIYSGITTTTSLKYLFFVVAVGCLICSVIAGRWSYKEESI